MYIQYNVYTYVKDCLFIYFYLSNKQKIIE